MLIVVRSDLRFRFVLETVVTVVTDVIKQDEKVDQSREDSKDDGQDDENVVVGFGWVVGGLVGHDCWL
jgi:hypothetical protein